MVRKRNSKRHQTKAIRLADAVANQLNRKELIMLLAILLVVHAQSLDTESLNSRLRAMKVHKTTAPRNEESKEALFDELHKRLKRKIG